MKKFEIRCPDCGAVMAQANNSRDLIGKEFTCDGPHDEVLTFVSQLKDISHVRKVFGVADENGKINHNKLVRDKIPAIIEGNGGECEYHIASKEEYAERLNEKVFEEAMELIKNPCAEEIADVLEVIECIARLNNIGLDDIKSAKMKKRVENGSFLKKIILDSASADRPPNGFNLRKGKEVIKPGYIK